MRSRPRALLASWAGGVIAIAAVVAVSPSRWDTARIAHARAAKRSRRRSPCLPRDLAREGSEPFARRGSELAHARVDDGAGADCEPRKAALAGVDVEGNSERELYERDIEGRSSMSKDELGDAVARRQD